MCDELQQQINKRLTLNWMIQGAASHTFLSAHHLVREDLEAIRPGLTKLYDKAAISLHLNYMIGDMPLFFGLPSRFWKRTGRPSHPFHNHKLLAEHGIEIYRASKRDLISRGWKKGIIGLPVFHYLQLHWMIVRLVWAERGINQELARIAEKATSMIWGIETERLDAELTRNVAFGNIRRPKTIIGRMVRSAVVGYGGVQLRNGKFIVTAKSWFFPLLVHELVKGTAELICLHGLNTLDEATYELATTEADQLEYETWMLQTGAEIWRRFLSVLPANTALPEKLMHVARLDPQSLDQLMLAVIEDPESARKSLAELA